MFSYNIYAQDTDQVKKRGPADDYSRSSISYLLLNFEGEKYSEELKRGIYGSIVPSKFDNNDMKQKVLKAPYYHSTTPNLKRNTEAVRRALAADLYANKVVKYWWRVRDDGSYSTDLIQKRGFYNATDIDVNEADAEKRGRAALADAGEKLIANSYVMVLDYNNVKTMTEIYDAQDAKIRKNAEKLKIEFKPVERKKNGYEGKLTAYLYKVNYSDTVQGYFMDAFTNENTLDLAKVDKIFNQVYSPFKQISTQSVKVDGTQGNPGEFLAPIVQKSKAQLMIKLVNDGIIKVINKLEKNLEAFRVKTPIVSTNPITAKIGKKEGLTHERRYFVWEYVEGNSGKTKAKRKGVIRARKVVDNRQDELGQTQSSVFYQIGGQSLEEGMTLQERKDMGIGIGGGYGGIGGLVRADINVGQWLNMPVRQFKLYIDYIFGSTDYTNVTPINSSSLEPSTMPQNGNYSENKFSIGILKEYPFARNFHAGWYVGYTGEIVTWDEETTPITERTSEQLSAGGVNWGFKLGTNLFAHNIQLIGTFGGHNYGEVTYASGIEDEENLDLGGKWVDIFPERTSSFSFDLSLRITF
ncbi:MAG: hypothetical protein DRI95_06440 [Bacteroidetes bacterium]|nr:MAG: hypothetical protein DRI95_06440 [Bacteroidota bacterium]